MKPWAWALLGGLCGAGAVVGVLASRKSRELQRRGASMQQALEAEGDQLTAYLISKGTGIEGELRQLAMDASERTATYHLATHYGLTPELVARLQQLPRLP